MITEEEFNAYEKVRQSGKTNMFDLKTVRELSGLGLETIREIQRDYTRLELTFKQHFKD